MLYGGPGANVRPLRRALHGILAVALASGCTYIPTTNLHYNPMPLHSSLSSSVSSLVVLPLTEARPPKRYPSMQGHLFKTYIPLLPYVKIPYERLDESHILHQKNTGSNPSPEEHFTIAFAKEIARDLGQSGMFREVRFAPTGSDAASSDFVLSGSLRSTEFDVYASSYMLGIVGVLLWLIPVPVGKDEATVSIDLVMRDAVGSELWSYSSSESADRLFTLYNAGGESTSSRFRVEIKRYGSNDLGIDGDSLWAYHAEALRAAVGEAKLSLATYLSQAQRSGSMPPR